MYEQDKTTKTWLWIKPIPTSKPEKARIKIKGNIPKMKKKNSK